ncbi:MAG TPA: hypothetical protein ENJ33_04200 [Thiothrix sp.]|nr:hypothetical protein [Thiothrix sp.]
MKHNHKKERLAQEAARLLYVEGYRDYQLAKQKAAEQLGMGNNTVSQPSHLEIHHALIKYASLFATKENKKHLNELRKIAIEAMGFLKLYSPRLTGHVMQGTAGLHAPITLHLFAETAEEVMFFLEDNNIPFQTHEQQHTIKNKKSKIPLLVFYVDDIEVELLLLPEGNIRVPPISHITGKKMQHIAIEEVKKLCETTKAE